MYFRGKFLGHLFNDFGCPFWGPKAMQKPSQGAMLAKRSDFENCCFVLFFTIKSGTPGLPREPQDSSRWRPGAFPKKGQLFYSILTP